MAILFPLHPCSFITKSMSDSCSKFLLISLLRKSKNRCRLVSTGGASCRYTCRGNSESHIRANLELAMHKKFPDF